MRGRGRQPGRALLGRHSNSNSRGSRRCHLHPRPLQQQECGQGQWQLRVLLPNRSSRAQTPCLCHQQTSVLLLSRLSMLCNSWRQELSPAPHQQQHGQLASAHRHLCLSHPQQQQQLEMGPLLPLQLSREMCCQRCSCQTPTGSRSCGCSSTACRPVLVAQWQQQQAMQAVAMWRRCLLLLTPAGHPQKVLLVLVEARVVSPSSSSLHPPAVHIRLLRRLQYQPPSSNYRHYSCSWPTRLSCLHCACSLR